MWGRRRRQAAAAAATATAAADSERAVARVLEEARRGEDAQRHLAAVLDQRAGVLLGFAGLLVTILPNQRARLGWDGALATTLAAPRRPSRPYLTVELLDDTIWRGEFVGFDSDPEDDHRNLALGPPLRRRRPNEEAFERRDREKSGGWRVVLLPEAQIKSIQVLYPPED